MSEDRCPQAAGRCERRAGHEDGHYTEYAEPVWSWKVEPGRAVQDGLDPDPGFADFVRAATGHSFEEGTSHSFVARPPDDLDPGRLASALHSVGGEICDPFTADHPVGMHNSQAAAIIAVLRAAPPSKPAGEVGEK